MNDMRFERDLRDALADYERPSVPVRLRGEVLRVSETAPKAARFAYSRGLRLAFSFAAIAIVAAVIVPSAWLRFAPEGQPQAAPAGLSIATDPPSSGCLQTRIQPIEITLSKGALAYRLPGIGRTVEVVWPSGFSARMTTPETAEIVDSHGRVVWKTGEVLTDLGGFGTPEKIHVCSIAGTVY